MKSYDAQVKVSASAERLLGLMTTAEYAQEEAIVDGAFTAKSSAENKGGKVVITTERVDPSRAPNGKIMKDKKEKSFVTSEWDTATMKSQWSTRVPGMEKLVKITGTTWLEKDGDCCKVCEKGMVSIGIPLVGDVIAKAIVEDLKKNFIAKKSFMEKKLGI